MLKVRRLKWAPRNLSDLRLIYCADCGKSGPFSPDSLLLSSSAHLEIVKKPYSFAHPVGDDHLGRTEPNQCFREKKTAAAEAVQVDAPEADRFNTRPFCGQVAQSVEQRTENPRVGSSILPLATIPFTDLPGS